MVYVSRKALWLPWYRRYMKCERTIKFRATRIASVCWFDIKVVFMFRRHQVCAGKVFLSFKLSFDVLFRVRFNCSEIDTRPSTLSHVIGAFGPQGANNISSLDEYKPTGLRFWFVTIRTSERLKESQCLTFIQLVTESQHQAGFHHSDAIQLALCMVDGLSKWRVIYFLRMVCSWRWILTMNHGKKSCYESRY